MAGTTHQIKAVAALDIGRVYRQFGIVTNSEPLAMPTVWHGKKIQDVVVTELGGLLHDAIWFYA